MRQFQVQKQELANIRTVTRAGSLPDLGSGEILIRVEKFGFSANNVTYGVAGDTLGYWQFFPPIAENPDGWGVLPVWGFAEVVASKNDQISLTERLFGYFPPATHLILKPESVAKDHFFDGAEHRSQLPKGYNLYRRVDGEPGYNPASDDLRMLLYPLYVTAFALWDQLKENKWYGAQQTIIMSASSKTSIGLAYALEADENAPKTVGLTSKKNLKFVESLGTYDEAVTYDDLETQIKNTPSSIVDMSGNAELLGQLHAHLGEDMRKTLNVGLTHWESDRKNEKIIRDRSEFFFAPSRVQQRIKDWGLDEFTRRSTAFVQETAAKSGAWLEMKELQGLEELEAIYDDVLFGKNAPQHGLIVKL